LQHGHRSHQHGAAHKPDGHGAHQQHFHPACPSPVNHSPMHPALLLTSRPTSTGASPPKPTPTALVQILHWISGARDITPTSQLPCASLARPSCFQCCIPQYTTPGGVAHCWSLLGGLENALDCRPRNRSAAMGRRSAAGGSRWQSHLTAHTPFSGALFGWAALLRAHPPWASPHHESAAADNT
jgi:hypothetical protein